MNNQRGSKYEMPYRLNSVEHKNTEKVARSMAEGMGADLADAKDVDLAKISGYDLIGFGSGIFKGKFHARLLKLVNELPQSGSKAFIFSTSGFGKTSYHNELRKMLEAKGYQVISDFACKGWDTYGLLNVFGGINKKRPNENDLKSAKEFAKRLIIKT
jgi:flavodoxin